MNMISNIKNCTIFLLYYYLFYLLHSPPIQRSPLYFTFLNIITLLFLKKIVLLCYFTITIIIIAFALRQRNCCLT